MHHSYIRWFEIAPIVVFIGGQFVVAALALLLCMTLWQARLHSRSRLQVGAIAAFLVCEVVLLSYVYQRPSTPGWFEPLFLFNGYALPLQLLVVLGLHGSLGWRAACANLGALLAVAFVGVCVLSMRGAGA